ncbi:MAG: transposase [Clostridia bacterium]|nr:transposase [Clostridia bacterium]
MAHVYRERPEIPIPPIAHINHSDGRVFTYLTDNPSKRTVIGHATSETTMHPNETFRALYPDLWNEAYSKKYNDPDELLVGVGLYALCLGASTSNGLYRILHDAYGPKFANVIMDYSMFSIISRIDVTQVYPERMKSEVVFSDRIYSDASLGHFFKEDMKPEMHDDFKILWLKEWIARGGKKLWVCIDGSNNDCQMEDSRYAEQGENKSHTHKNIVGYIYAVDSETGEPVTYFVNPGGEVDCQTFQGIITFLTSYKLEIEGVILDRGFCTNDVVQTLKELHLDYVIMVKEAEGFNTLLDEHGEDIFWNPKYLVDEDKGVFGLSKEVKIWKTHPTRGIMNLYFSAWQGCKKGIELLKKVCEAKRLADKACVDGNKPTFEKKVNKFFDVDEEPDAEGKYHFTVRYDQWMKSLRSQSCFSMLSSKDYGPQKSYQIYQLRMASETQYRILKSQEGFDTTRVHTDNGMLSKYAICFAASILRYSIMSACMKQGVDVNVLLQRTARVSFMRRDNGQYVFVRKSPVDYRKVIGAYGMEMSMFDKFAEDYNHRMTSPINSQVHKLPQTVEKQKAKRGRPLGSKNRKTLEREAAQAETPAQPKKIGRPVGSKDSKPRRKRSDAGIKRGPHRKANEAINN